MREQLSVLFDTLFLFDYVRFCCQQNNVTVGLSMRFDGEANDGASREWSVAETQGTAHRASPMVGAFFFSRSCVVSFSTPFWLGLVLVYFCRKENREARRSLGSDGCMARKRWRQAPTWQAIVQTGQTRAGNGRSLPQSTGGLGAASCLALAAVDLAHAPGNQKRREGATTVRRGKDGTGRWTGGG